MAKREKATAYDADGMEQSPLYEEIYRVKEKRANVRFFAVLFAILACFLFLRAAFTSSFVMIDVDGSSMLPTLRSHDALLMQYVSSDENDGVPLRFTRTPKRGDVIIVDVRKYDFSGNVDFLIKRLVGIEGDTVSEENGQIYILSKEDKAAGVSVPVKWAEQPENVVYHLGGFTYDVGEGEVFFLGDNTDRSTDSRYKEDGKSHLNCLYKASDICGVVPKWAIAIRGFSTFLSGLGARSALF